MPTGVTGVLAKYVAQATYEQLPPEVMDRTKLVMFDELACAVLGRQLRPGSLIAEYVRRLGQVPESTVVGTTGMAPSAWAAMANGTAGHADEFDGTHVTEGHPGAVIVHGALAVGERNRCDGPRLINAVALGFDIGTRLVDAVGGASWLRESHHLHADFLHGFGAAAAAASIMNLDEVRIRYSWALTAAQATGLAAVFSERSHMSKAFANGQAAFAGVCGADLAAIGFEGSDRIFETQHGVLQAWAPDGADSILADGLGTDYAILGSNFKLLSAGYPIHAAVEGALGLLEERNLEASQLTRIVVRMNTRAADTVDERAMPSICLQDMLSIALVFRKLGFEEAHSSTALMLPAVRDVREKISIVRDEGLDRADPRGRGAVVELETVSGGRFAKKVDYPRGHSALGGVTWEEIYAKWDNILPKLLTDRGYYSFRELIKSLHELEDVSELATALRRGGSLELR